MINEFPYECGGAWCRIHHTETGRDIPEPGYQNKPEFFHIDTLNIFTRLDIAKKHAAVWKETEDIGNDFRFAKACFEELPIAFEPEVLGAHGQDLSVMVMAVCRNEKLIAPFFLRHYETIADKILIYDGGSTDGSLELLRDSPKVEIVKVPEEKMNNRNLTDFRNEAWKKYRYDYDFVIVCDMDELIFHPQLKEKLNEFKKQGITTPTIKGYQMVAEQFPHGYSGQIYEIVQKGYYDPIWLSKVSVFNPADVDVSYEVGCHQANSTGKLKKSDEPLYLLHFKYVGYRNFIAKNKREAARLSETDLKNGYAFHYARDAKMTIEEFRELEKKSTSVLDKSLKTRTDLQAQNPYVFEEIITKNQYRVSKGDFVGRNVIDIGAHNGLFSLLARENDAEEIIALEPQPATVKLLQQNVIGNNITVVPMAIGPKDGEYVEMVMRPDFTEADARLYSQPSATGIETTTLDSLIKLIKNDKPILLKVDAEGAEYDLFYNASAAALDRVQTICIEMHEDIFRFEGRKGLIDKLRHFIIDAGFSETFMENYVGDKVRLLRYDKITGSPTLKKHMEVTVGIPTKNRYFSTLPPALLSVMMQTYPVKKLIIVDDSDPDKDGKMTDLRNDPMYQYLFSMISKKGIEWEVVYGQHKGQHYSHQIILDKTTTPFILRVDDDIYLEPNVLEELMKQMTDGVGAVGGLVLNPKSARLAEDGYINTNKLNDIYSRENTQWVKQKEGQVFEVEHLYSSFLYRKVDDIKFCLELSPAAHREESIFSYEYFRKGWKLLVTTNCTSWHFQNPSGGIRSYSDPKLWEHDEEIFKRKLESWKIDMEGKKLWIADCGIGDTIVAMEWLPDLLKKFPNLIIATYYPLLFKKFPNVKIIHPWQAKDLLSEKGAELQNVYKLLWDEHNKGNKLTLKEAYRILMLEML